MKKNAYNQSDKIFYDPISDFRIWKVAKLIFFLNMSFCGNFFCFRFLCTGNIFSFSVEAAESFRSLE